MKTKLFLALMGMLFAFSNAKASNSPVTNEIPWPKIKIDIKYIAGLPDNRHVCVGAGTCHVIIDITVGMVAGNGETIVHDVEVTRDDQGRMIMRFPKSSLTGTVTSDLFGLGTYRLANEAVISNEVKSQIQLPASYTIQPGAYNFTETATYFEVTF